MYTEPLLNGPPPGTSHYMDRDALVCEALRPHFAALIARGTLAGWSEHELGYALASLSITLLTRLSTGPGASPEARRNIHHVPEQMREMIEHVMLHDEGRAIAIPGA